MCALVPKPPRGVLGHWRRAYQRIRERCRRKWRYLASCQAPDMTRAGSCFVIPVRKFREQVLLIAINNSSPSTSNLLLLSLPQTHTNTPNTNLHTQNTQLNSIQTHTKMPAQQTNPKPAQGGPFCVIQRAPTNPKPAQGGPFCTVMRGPTNPKPAQGGPFCSVMRTLA